MKEATGELSTTVIAVVAIAAIAAIFTAFILPGLKGTILAKTHCASAINCKTSECNGSGGDMSCEYYDEKGNIVSGKLKCPCAE